MPAALKIILTPEEDRTLKELELADRVPRRTLAESNCIAS